MITIIRPFLVGLTLMGSASLANARTPRPPLDQ